jgi:threonine/homoserine/homoserine lactone efflux protein
MELNTFLIGIIVGFTLAVPIGPIGFLSIRQTLSRGQFPGILVGLGAATADLLYSGIAAFGLTVFSNALNTQQTWIRITGGVIILLVGARIFITKYKTDYAPLKSSGIIKLYGSSFLLTLTNPLTIFAFITIFASLGLGKELSHFSAAVVALGVFIGSFLWFVLLTTIVNLFKGKMSLDLSLRINKITGGIIFLAGIIAIFSPL